MSRQDFTPGTRKAAVKERRLQLTHIQGRLERLEVLPQLILPVGHAEPSSLELCQVERGVDRARGDGAGGAGVVVGGADRHDHVAVAVGGLEDGAGDVGP